MQGHLRAPLRLHVWGADAALAFFGGETEGGRCRERVEDAQEGALVSARGPATRAGPFAWQCWRICTCAPVLPRGAHFSPFCAACLVPFLV